MVLGGALGLGFVACDARGAAPLCVAGVALGDIHLDITWHAWHKLTSTVVLRGRRSTYGTGWRPLAGICRLWRPGRRATLRGRRGTWWHPPWLHARSFCMAGASLMALGDIHLDFTWQAAWHNLTSMTPSVDPDYMPGMIASHRACRKSSQNLRLRPRECRTLLWSAEVWWAHHRFDSRAWWNSKKAEQFTHKQPTHKQLTLHTYIHDIHTYIHTYLPTYIHTYIHSYLLDLSPPLLSFLPSLSPLKPLKLILGRSWLVGLSGPLIFVVLNNRLVTTSSSWFLTNCHQLPSIAINCHELPWTLSAGNHFHRTPLQSLLVPRRSRSAQLPGTETPATGWHRSGPGCHQRHCFCTRMYAFQKRYINIFIYIMPQPSCYPRLFTWLSISV